jgi:U3 small nucleolar RNA-associated protein 3
MVPRQRGGGEFRKKVRFDTTMRRRSQSLIKDTEEFLQQSDEEVLGYSSPSEVEDDDEDDFEDEAPAKKSKKDAQQQEEDEEDMEAWGESKQDYYNADAIETEQDALDEEKEALRLQKKQLQAMSAADFGFDEADWQQEDEQDADQDGEVVTEVLPQLELDDKMAPAERLKLLKTRYPEFEPLSKELLALHQTYQDLSAVESPSLAVQTKQQAAAAYLASLTMYFALLTSTAQDTQTKGLALSAATIRDHPVMESLIQCRDLWSRLRDLPEDDSEDESALEEAEFEGMSESEEEETPVTILPKKTKKTAVERAADAVTAAIQARRAERLRKTEADFGDLDALLTTSATRPKKSSKKSQQTAALDENDSDLGEDTSLTAAELAEKAKRKKSLRFYTSQIAQKANKRGAKVQGGDEDVPHRERLRDRQARLNAEAESRSKRFDRDQLGEDSEDDNDRAVARQVRGEKNLDDGEDDYYDMVASKAAKKKSDKAAEAAAFKEAAASGGRIIEKEEVGPDGKRAITYAIEKNKGLTPHRKKDVRNPRVKKRKKFEEKKKKLASIKPVYKGGEGRGGYGGELTGIKKGLVRSTKL